MSKLVTLEKISKETIRLSANDQLKLAEMLIHRIANAKMVDSKTKPEKIYGAGKGIWNVDAQDYVNDLRAERL